MTLLGSILQNEDTSGFIQCIERGIYNWCIDYATEKGIARSWKCDLFRKMYVDKVRSVALNLDGESYVGNVRLIHRLKDKEFLPSDLAAMDRHRVFPEVWQKTIESKMRRDAQLGENTVASMTDQFKCRKCKKRETIYYEVQTRSADEPMDLRIYCLNCGNRWRA
jgi:DNA-directed RNA polymerase subunit M/transcription elongation factor TFIIS